MKTTSSLSDLLRTPVRLVGYRPAQEVIPEVGPRRFLHSGPPLDPEAPLPGALVGAIIAGLLFEEQASDVTQARGIIEQGGVAMVPCQDARAVGPLTGLVTPRTPVVVVERPDGRRYFSPVHEGEVGGMRAGHFDPGTLDRLQHLARIVAPALDAAVAQGPPIDVTQLQSSALRRGDECHNRNVAATQALMTTLAPGIVRATPGHAAEILEVLAATPQHFINLSAATAMAITDLVDGRGPTGVVTGMGMNGRDAGIQVSGIEGWLTAPAPVGPMVPLDGADIFRAQPGQGDSVIIEAIGLGAFALSAALPLAARLGVSVDEAREVVASMRTITVVEHPLFEIPEEGFRGSPAVIDVRAVSSTATPPVVTMGFLHQTAGKGRVGVGLSRLPLELFTRADDALNGCVAPDRGGIS